MLGFRVWVAAGLLSLAACSSADDEEPDVETPAEASQAFCRGKCEGERRCNLSDESCESLCINDFTPTGYREGVLAEAGACLAEEHCTILANEFAADVCLYEVSIATAMTDPTQVLFDYCEGAAQRYFECDMWWSVDDCVDGMAMWTDDVLIEATACLRERCDVLVDCDTAVFDKYR